MNFPRLALVCLFTAAVAPAQRITSPDFVELIVPAFQQFQIAGLTYRYTSFDHLTAGHNGGWIAEARVQQLAGNYGQIIIGQPAGQTEGPVQILVGPPADVSYFMGDLVDDRIAYIVDEGGFPADRRIVVDGVDLIEIGDPVSGAPGWVWDELDYVRWSQTEEVFVIGRARNPANGVVYTMAINHTRGEVLFDGLSFVPGAPRRIGSTGPLSISPNGEHWAIVATTRALPTQPDLSLVIVDGEVVQFQDGSRAIEELESVPDFASFGDPGAEWLWFYRVDINDEGTWALVGTVRHDAAGAPVDTRVVIRGDTLFNAGVTLTEDIVVDEAGGIVEVTGVPNGFGVNVPGIRYEGAVVTQPVDQLGIDEDMDGVVEPGLFASSLQDPALVLEGSRTLFILSYGAGTFDFRRAIAEARPYRLNAALCDGLPNSTGNRAELVSVGSSAAAENGIDLRSFGLPSGSAGHALVSRATGTPVIPPGSQGELCLAGSIGRLRSELFITSANGLAQMNLDTGAFPTPTGTVAATAGETWFFQVWYRDAVGGAATSNFTSGIGVTLK